MRSVATGAACGHGAGLENARARMRLEARDETAAGVVQLRPPGKVIISKVEDVGGAGLDRHRLGHAHVVDARRRDRDIGRDGAVGIEVDVQLHERAVRLVVGPGARHVGQADAGRIDEVDGLARARRRPRLALRGEHGEQIGKQLRGPLGIGVGERRAGRRRGTEMIETLLVARHGLLDLAQALGARELRIDQRDELALGRQPTHARVGAMLSTSRSNRSQGTNCKS